MADISGISREEFLAPGHTACLGCGEAIAIRHILKVAGKNTIIVQATGCPEVYTTLYPNTAWRIPWIHVAFENAAAVASGVREGLNQEDKKDVNVIAIAGDGGTFDIGLQALSGMLERHHKVLYICLDNGAYENTGVQRSSATPKYAWTTTSPIGKEIKGKRGWKKPMPLIVAAHEIPYVATASLSDLQDLIRKVRKALAIDGPSYIQILCPCIPGWKMESNKTIEYSDLAVKTKINPIYEIEGGLVKVQETNNPLPVINFLKDQGRFKHLTSKEIKNIQQHIDEKYKKLKDLENSKIKL
ncbi:2-ketoisovalerate ferredoxin oxidoreductase [Candidatus Woesearchaeota archaeon B3_Woes]|nr:MAG: 2-ketoisovalerate ferredoxin oxidoreductase [Candidatus Woesearchaeota archaeon B3_Woes]